MKGKGGNLMKRIAVLAILGLVAASLVVPSTTAQAATGVAVGTCSVTLPQWPTDSGSVGGDGCTGTAIGAGIDSGSATPLVCIPGCGFSATVENYSEPCVLNEPPLVGTANGVIRVDANNDGSYETEFGSYSWTRVGVVAIILPNGADPAGSAGVAAFVPSLPLGSCSEPASNYGVTVAGGLVSAL
jgi:hypothetical protein